MNAMLPAPTDVSSPTEHVAITPVPSPHRATTHAARAHRLIARVLLGGLALQLFFAGLGVFGLATFLPHMILGTLIVLASFALPLVAWRGHLESALLHRSVLLAGLMMLQGLLIDVGRVVHVVAALHPVNAMLLILVTYSLARRDIQAVEVGRVGPR